MMGEFKKRLRLAYEQASFKGGYDLRLCERIKAPMRGMNPKSSLPLSPPLFSKIVSSSYSPYRFLSVPINTKFPVNRSPFILLVSSFLCFFFFFISFTTVSKNEPRPFRIWYNVKRSRQ